MKILSSYFFAPFSNKNNFTHIKIHIAEEKKEFTSFYFYYLLREVGLQVDRHLGPRIEIYAYLLVSVSGMNTSMFHQLTSLHLKTKKNNLISWIFLYFFNRKLTSIIKFTTVVWCWKQCHKLSLCKEFIAIFYYLMCPTY